MSHNLAVTLRLSALSLLLAFTSNVHAASDDIDREFDVAANGTLRIESDSGSIDVHTWDQNRVRVRVRNHSRFEVDSKADCCI